MRGKSVVLCALLLALVCSWLVAQEVAPAAKKLKFKALKYSDTSSPLTVLKSIYATSDKEAVIFASDEENYGYMSGVNRKGKVTTLNTNNFFPNRADTLWVEVDSEAGPSASMRGIVVSWNVHGVDPYTIETYTTVFSAAGTRLSPLTAVHQLEDPLDNRFRVGTVRAGLGEKSILVAAAIRSTQSDNISQVKSYLTLFELDFDGRPLGKPLAVALPSNGNQMKVYPQQPVWVFGQWMVPVLYEKDVDTLGQNEGSGVMIVSTKRKNKGGLNSGSLTTQMHSAFKLRGLGHNVYNWLQAMLVPIEQKNAPAASSCMLIYETDVANEGEAHSVYYSLAKRYAVAVDAGGKTKGSSKLIPMKFFDPPNPGTGDARNLYDEIAGPLYTNKGEVLLVRSLYVNTGSDSDENAIPFSSVEVYRINPDTLNSKMLAKTPSVLSAGFESLQVSRSGKRIWVACEDGFGGVQVASFKSK